MDEHHENEGGHHDMVEDHPEYPKKEPHDSDISRKTLVILVVLSVSISLIGALAMVYELSSVQMAPIILEDGGADSAKVSFAIRSGDELPEETAASATGRVSLDIQR